MWIQSLQEHRETAAGILAAYESKKQGLGETTPVKSDLQISHASSATHQASFTSQSNSSASRIKTRRLAHTAAKLPVSLSALQSAAGMCQVSITPFAGGYRPTSFFGGSGLRQKKIKIPRQATEEQIVIARTALAKDMMRATSTHFGSLPCAVDHSRQRCKRASRARVILRPV